MNITQIQLNELNLISSDYNFVILGLFDIEKDTMTNNLFTDGDSFNRSKIRDKKLVLNGLIKTWDLSKIIALNQVISGNGLKVLSLYIQGIGALTTNVEIVSKIAGENSRKISMQLIMPDPYLYQATQQVVNLGALSNSSLVLPITLPFTLGSITGGQGTITNMGSTVAYPVINIVGTCDTLKITNETTGESMSLNVSLGANDQIIIDNRPSTRGIYLNGVKRMDLKNGSWLSCTVGDNIFTFTRNSLENKLHCTVILQSRWI